MKIHAIVVTAGLLLGTAALPARAEPVEGCAGNYVLLTCRPPEGVYPGPAPSGYYVNSTGKVKWYGIGAFTVRYDDPDDPWLSWEFHCPDLEVCTEETGRAVKPGYPVYVSIDSPTGVAVVGDVEGS